MKDIELSYQINEVECQQLEINNVKEYFPERYCCFQKNKVTSKTFKKLIKTKNTETFNELSEENFKRTVFTKYPVLTIDCINTKDKDDAVYTERKDYGYRVMVHIADVSKYVPHASFLDDLACDRSTSVYLPNKTIHMLPEILSQNICSLNPGEKRNTLSIIIRLDHDCNVIDYKIVKGLIQSRVSGVYDEVNLLLDDKADKYIRDKYKDVTNQLFLMHEVYEKLRARRIRLGATIEDDNKPRIHIDRFNIDITPHEEGLAENMIEEYMILANHLVAEFISENDLPGIYRVQEEKNHLAAYKPIKKNHAELALESYAHFTSPIRRVADLKLHQIITMYLNGYSSKALHQIFDDELPEVCDRATRRSRTAKQIQDYCERYCYEQFFKLHPNDKYTGCIVGFDIRNKPIVKIDNFNIRITGNCRITGDVGDKYSFEVRSYDHKNGLFTYSSKSIKPHEWE